MANNLESPQKCIIFAEKTNYGHTVQTSTEQNQG